MINCTIYVISYFDKLYNNYIFASLLHLFKIKRVNDYIYMHNIHNIKISVKILKL